MIRRLFWISVGALLALWGRRKASRAVDRYVPKVVSEKVAKSVKHFVNDVARSRDDAKREINDQTRRNRPGSD